MLQAIHAGEGLAHDLHQAHIGEVLQPIDVGEAGEEHVQRLLLRSLMGQPAQGQPIAAAL